MTEESVNDSLDNATQQWIYDSVSLYFVLQTKIIQYKDIHRKRAGSQTSKSALKVKIA